jgi:hypothetical protein
MFQAIDGKSPSSSLVVLLTMLVEASFYYNLPIFANNDPAQFTGNTGSFNFDEFQV